MMYNQSHVLQLSIYMLRMDSREYRWMLGARARSLRANMTRAERVLWECIRNRHLGGFKFYRQKVCLNYIVDFYNSETNLVIEVDGGYHKEQQYGWDADRETDLRIHGYGVIRFTNDEVLFSTEAVCAKILDEIYRRIDAL